MEALFIFGRETNEMCFAETLELQKVLGPGYLQPSNRDPLKKGTETTGEGPCTFLKIGVLKVRPHSRTFSMECMTSHTPLKF